MKIHAGKSRNDQVIADLKLYSKKKLLGLENSITELIKELEKFSRVNAGIEMPGYSHFRKAMPSSIELWSLSFAESLKDDLKYIKATREWIDKNALGAAAGFGSNLNLDRGITTKALGFKKTQKNYLYIINSRSKFESAVLFALTQVMLSLNKFATDVIIFSSEHFGFLELAREICTGSSMMPHKKNPDAFEILRAKSEEIQSFLFHSLTNSNSLPSGYNRDSQLAKAPLIKGLESALECVEITKHMIPKIKVNKENCEKALGKEMLSAEKAIETAKKGVPFREAYKTAAVE